MFVGDVLGCRIEFSDEPVELLHNESIAIDWNEAFFKRLFHAEELVEIREHETVKEHWEIQHRCGLDRIYSHHTHVCVWALRYENIISIIRCSSRN